MANCGVGIDPRTTACGENSTCVKSRLQLAPPQTSRNLQRAKTDEAIVACRAVGSAHPHLSSASGAPRLSAGKAIPAKKGEELAWRQPLLIGKGIQKNRLPLLPDMPEIH